MKIALAVGVLAMALASCTTPPPKSWLRFVPNGAHDWAMGPQGVWVTRMHGVDFSLDLQREQARIQVIVENRSPEPLVIRMGPEGSMTTNAIGEVLLRPIESPPGHGGPEMEPYVNLKRITVAANWRGTFYIDSPLGRDIGLGTFLVFTVEAHDTKGDIERRKMPLLATNAGAPARGGT